MKKSDLSIIVPVYNTAKFLPKCINSLIRQTKLDIEIILVNDGSTDDSLSICQEFAECDPRIKLINKTNGGVSSARNAGLKVAIGSWITFVDSDDYVEECMYEKLLAIANNDTDTVISGYVTEYINNLSQLNSVPNFIKNDYVNESINHELIPFFIYYGRGIGKRPLMGSAFRMIIQYSLLQNHQICFPNIKFCEDLCFFLDVLNVSQCVHIERSCYYHYVKHADSITQNFLPNLVHDILYVLKKVSTIRQNFAGKFQGYPDNRYEFLITLIRNLSRKSASIFAIRKELIQILKMENFYDVCDNIVPKNLPKAQKILFYPIKFKLAFVIVLLFKMRKLVQRPIDV